MTSNNQGPVRILHVVGRMNTGGVETWLMHVLRHLDRSHFYMDFLVHTNQACAYDQEILSRGSKIIPCLHPHRPWLYALNFRRSLHEHGPYDVIHSHVHHYSGFVLRLARQFGVPIRIAHSHTVTLPLPIKEKLLRQAYLNLMKRLIAQNSVTGLAASRQAAVDLFGPAWEDDPRWQTLYYGVDLAPFQARIDRTAIRTELGLPLDAFVIGHVGRFAEPKNHIFLLNTAAEIFKREPKAHLLLIGDGPLHPMIEQKVIKMGLADRVTFTGVRPDVPRLMLGAMDLFLFPSLYEGLGLALIEAQAAGLPCVFSDIVPEEADVVKPLMRRLSLAQPASTWAEEVLAVRETGSLLSRSEALAVVVRSVFNIRTSVEQLERVYCD